jgi:hypothetical protein
VLRERDRRELAVRAGCDDDLVSPSASTRITAIPVGASDSTAAGRAVRSQRTCERRVGERIRPNRADHRHVGARDGRTRPPGWRPSRRIAVNLGRHSRHGLTRPRRDAGTLRPMSRLIDPDDAILGPHAARARRSSTVEPGALSRRSRNRTAHATQRSGGRSSAPGGRSLRAHEQRTASSRYTGRHAIRAGADTRRDRARLPLHELAAPGPRTRTGPRRARLELEQVLRQRPLEARQSAVSTRSAARRRAASRPTGVAGTASPLPQRSSSRQKGERRPRPRRRGAGRNEAPGAVSSVAALLSMTGAQPGQS